MIRILQIAAALGAGFLMGKRERPAPGGAAVIDLYHGRRPTPVKCKEFEIKTGKLKILAAPNSNIRRASFGDLEVFWFNGAVNSDTEWTVAPGPPVGGQPTMSVRFTTTSDPGEFRDLVILRFRNRKCIPNGSPVVGIRRSSKGEEVLGGSWSGDRFTFVVGGFSDFAVAVP